MRSVLASLIVGASLFLFFSFHVEGQNVLAKFKKDVGGLVLNETHYKKGDLCHKPLLFTIVGGSQGFGKSSLLKALGRLLNVPNSEFKSGSDYTYCTDSISTSDANNNGLIFLDLMGRNDGTFGRDVGLDADRVDLMATSLVVPFANIIIYSMKDSIRADDLKWIPVFSEMIQSINIPVHKDAPKPLLILTLRSKPRGKTPNEIFDRFIRDDNIKSKFHAVKYILIDEVNGEEESLLQEGNFFPEKVPSYWSSVQEIGRMITSHADVITNQYRWTGCEANEIMINNLPRINEQQSIDPPSIYKLLVSRRITNAVDSAVETILISAEVKEWIANPLQQEKDVKDLLQKKFDETEKVVRDKFLHYQSEGSLKDTIHTALKKRLDQHLDSTMTKVGESIRIIEDEALKAKEITEREFETISKVINLTGYPADINCKAKKELDVSMQAYTKKMTSVKVSDSRKETDRKFFDEKRKGIIALKHTENELKRGNKRDGLYNNVRTKSEYLSDYHKVCANGQDEFRINLAERLPAYFRSDVLPYLHHVTAELDGNEVCSGALTLTDSREFQVCKQYSTCCSNGQHKITELHYDSSNAHLRLYLKLGNWGSGCKNFIEFKGIRLTIQQRAIVDELALARPYDRNEGFCE
eukprot:gene5416-5813_t